MTEATLYHVLPGPDGSGGKPVAVIGDASGNLQTRARASGAPLTVFVREVSPTSLVLDAHTPAGPKGFSDTAALAALFHLGEALGDVAEIEMGGEAMTAQRCGGDWLLRQGEVEVAGVDAGLSGVGVEDGRVWRASAGRPNLVIEISEPALHAFAPDADAISALNRATDTTGLVLFAAGGPRGVAATFRTFGPLKGFLEDAASCNMAACLVGALGAANLLPDDTNLVRLSQAMPGCPARLSAQFGPGHGGLDVWIGGRATPI